VARLDGTRYYTGSSNRVNLQTADRTTTGAGGLFYRPAQGFAVEAAPRHCPRSTRCALDSGADRWPLGDTYAYHDWHFGGNGDTASFMRTLQTSFGAAAVSRIRAQGAADDYVSYAPYSKASRLSCGRATAAGCCG